MSPELAKIEFEDKSMGIFEINGPLNDQQKEEIEDIIDGYGKFIICSNQEERNQFLIISGNINHKNMWNSIKAENPSIILRDAGMYDIRWGEHLIRDYSTSLISTPLLNITQINKSRAFLRETLGIDVADAHI